ncbi:MAG: hypothetical protein PHS88_12255, partial [Candidatus Omnitrophica bacterium]|nr:hypothetical protein [Candidatus Omnitrophota bacterium]
MNRKLTIHLIAVFLFAALFIFCYWVGLPTDFNADHITTNLRGAEAASYKDLIKLTLDPLTPAWFYPAEGLMEYLRPLQFLWMKVYFQFFQSSLIPFHVTAAIGLGLLSALMVYLIYYWTGSLLFGWLAVCLYASFPSNYYMLTSTFSGDFQFYVSLLSLSAMLLCCRLSFGSFRRPAAFFAAFALWIIAIWIAVKLKSSEKVIPFVCLAFLVWRFHFIRNKIGWLRLGVLFAGILAMMLLVVPVKPFKAWVDQYQIHATSRSLATRVPQTTEAVTQKDKTTLAFNWQNMLARTFYVPGGEFPLTTVLRRKIPQSCTENYGFFLDWFFWLSLVLTPFMLARA